MNKFTSIFNKNTEVDANLSNLFNSKSVNNNVKSKTNLIAEKSSKPNIEKENFESESDSDNDAVTHAGKMNTSKENTEDRTIFIGNLHNDVKKEVLNVFLPFIENFKYFHLIY